MSVHLFIAAAYLPDLDPSVKWVLAAIADSADEHTLESAPGLPKLRAWSGRSKSQVTRIVGDLEASGHIARISPGRLGRRAVYRVFPAGVPAIPAPAEVAARFVSTGVDNDQSYAQDDAEEGRTDAPHRGAYDAARGAPMRPLQSSTSVSMVPTPQPSTGPRVDNRPTSSPAATRSGFPGARTKPADDDAVGAARRARGAMDRPCPVADHGALGEVNGGCGRCAHTAANANPATVAAARKAARQGIAKTRTTTAPTTEETRSA